MAYLLGRLGLQLHSPFKNHIPSSSVHMAFDFFSPLLAAYGSFSLVEVFTDKLISWYYWTSQNYI